MLKLSQSIGSASSRSGLFSYEGNVGDVRGSLRTGLFGYEESGSSVKRARASKSSMVADEYEYQTQRQRDIRSRLELKEKEKQSRRGGPLVGRLALHQVFRRLE